jgi:hypothetical protein
MLPPVIYLYPNNTQVIQITELQDQITGLFLTNAQVTATLLDQKGTPDAILNNIVMSYVPGSDATYQGTVPSSFNASLGGGYTLQVIAVQAGVQAEYSIPAIVQLRKQ